jgi:hypothetical protein
MMKKSGLERIILKFHEPLQRYLLIQPFWADCFALGSSTSEGAGGISK